MNYFKLWIGDYQRDTGTLSLAEHGAYMLMLQAYYATERPLPSGSGLHRLLRAQGKTEKAAIDHVAEMFWHPTKDGLVNTRSDKEIARSRKQADSNRETAIAREAARREHDSCSGRATNDQRTHSHSHRPEPQEQKQEQELPTTSGVKTPPLDADPIFGVGLDFLRRKGVPERSARSFLGLLRKEVRDDITVAAMLGEAERQDVSDPQAWLTKAVRTRNSNGHTSPQTGTPRQRRELGT